MFANVIVNRSSFPILVIIVTCGDHEVGVPAVYERGHLGFVSAVVPIIAYHSKANSAIVEIEWLSASRGWYVCPLLIVNDQPECPGQVTIERLRQPLNVAGDDNRRCITSCPSLSIDYFLDHHIFDVSCYMLDRTDRDPHKGKQEDQQNS